MTEHTPASVDIAKDIIDELRIEMPEIPRITKSDLKCMYVRALLNQWIEMDWATEEERVRLVTAYREILKDSADD